MILLFLHIFLLSLTQQYVCLFISPGLYHNVRQGRFRPNTEDGLCLSAFRTSCEPDPLLAWQKGGKKVWWYTEFIICNDWFPVSLQEQWGCVFAGCVQPCFPTETKIQFYPNITKADISVTLIGMVGWTRRRVDMKQSRQHPHTDMLKSTPNPDMRKNN